MSETSNRPKSTLKSHNSSDQVLKNPQEKPTKHLKDLSNLNLSHKNQENEAEKSVKQKKINSLLAEVERLAQENSELASLLHEERMKSGEVQRKAKNSGKIKNVVDRNLQNELKYEKEEACRLRHLLTQVENERSELLSKIKDLEITISTFSYEKIELVNAMQENKETIFLLQKENKEAIVLLQKENKEAIAVLEKENKQLVQNLVEMNKKLNEKESELSEFRCERVNLCEALAAAETQKAETEKKFYVEREKLSEMTIVSQKDIHNIKFVHNKHTKVLAGQNILMKLSLIASKTSRSCFQALKFSANRKKARYQKLNRLILIPEKYIFRKLKYFCDIWKSKLNWKSTYLTRQNLVQNFQHKVFTSKHFSHWRKMFILKRQQKIHRFWACDKIFKLFFSMTSKSVKTNFIAWNNKVSQIMNKQRKIFRVFFKFYLRSLKNSVKVWAGKTEILRGNQIIDDLATDFGALLAKSKFFYAFKQISQVKKIRREFEFKQQIQADLWHGKKIVQDLSRYTQKRLLKLKMLKKLNRKVYQKDVKRVLSKWKNFHIIEQQQKTLNKLLMRKNSQFSKKEAEKIFYVWKEFQLRSKLEKCKNELEVEKPQRHGFQAKVQDLMEKEKENKKLLTIRVFRKLANQKIFSFFRSWKTLLRGYKLGLRLLKKYLIIFGINRAKYGFDKWKNGVHNKKILELSQKYAVKINENKLMTEHIGLLERALDVSDTTLKTVSKNSMKSALNKIVNLNLLSALRVWARNVFKISNKMESGQWIAGVLTKSLLGVYFGKIQFFCQKQTKRNKQSRVLQKFKMVMSKESLRNTFGAWMDFTMDMRRFRRDCAKFLHKKGLVLKRIFWQKWFLKQVEIKNRDYTDNYNVLINEKEKLCTEYNSLSDNYEKEQENSKLYLKTLKKCSQLRIFNAFHQCSKDSLHTHFNKWCKKAQSFSKKLLKMKKIINLFLQSDKKKSFTKWLIFQKNHVALAGQTEIKKHIHDKKVVVRQHKEVQGKLEAEINLKELKIKQLDIILRKELKIKEFFLKRSIKHQNQEYSENRAAFAFKVLKARYQRIKSHTIQLAKLIKLAQKKNAFEAIIETVKHQIFVNNLYDKLYLTFTKYSKLYLKRLFEMWKIGSYEVVIKRNNKKIKESDEKSRKLDTLKNLNKQKYCQKVLKFVNDHKKRAILMAWQKTGRKLRLISNSNRKLSSVLRHSKLQNAFKHFSRFLNNRKSSYEKLQASSNFYIEKLLKKSFETWKLRKCIIKSLLKKFISFTSSSTTFNKSVSFIKLKFNSINAAAKDSSKKDSQTKRLKHLTNILYLNQLKIAISTWKESMKIQFNNKKLLRRSILRALHRKLSSGLKAWQRAQIVQKTTEKVNNSGSVAQENTFLIEKTKILEQFLKSEKIDPKHIDRFIQERESLGLAIRRKGQIAKFNKKHLKILPTSFIAWRLWTVKRKRITKTFARLHLFRHNSSLLHSFLLWKHTMPALNKSISHCTRQNLIVQIKTLTNSCKSLKSKLDTSQNELIYMKAYSSILEEHTKRGQNLTMMIHKNNIKKAYFQTFLRWVVHCNLCKVHDLLTSLTKTEEKLYLAQSQIKDLSLEYMALEQDNFELRQASLDGIAIADAFETLSREREKLTKDLEERTLTVKKLLQHNSLLSFKLKQLGVEEKYSPVEEKKFNKFN